MRRAHVAVLTLALTWSAAPVFAQTLTFVEGFVRDTAGFGIANVCVTFGPPTVCTTATDATGYYRFDGVPTGTGADWEILFTKEGFAQRSSGRFKVTGPTRIDATLVPGASSCPRPGSPHTTIYLPNITKTLGGPAGWQTPFIVQNVSQFVITALELEFYRFSDGALVARRWVCAVKPGTSFADVPNNDTDLPHDTQFSVVVRSWMADAVAVVNEHAGSGARAEAASYVGASAGSTSVFLPNIVKRFFGFVTPFIIQNLGASATTAQASFVSFDGTHTATLFRTISPGRSQFIDPNNEPLLRDGTQYAVTVTASEPLSVVVNTHNDAPSVAAPTVYSANGLTSGAASLLGPYAVKNVPGVGKGVSTIVVQNLGTTAATPALQFLPLGGGTATTFTGPSVAPRASWASDPRYTDGDTTKPFCGPDASAGCLANGEYSFLISATGGQLATVVNVIGSATAAGYAAIPGGSVKVYLPNVTRTLGGTAGWTTPVVVQSDTATGATLKWYRFSDGALVITQTISLSPGASAYIDPRGVAGLSDNTQYAVVAEGTGGTIVAIVHELNFQGGDGAMVYEGFAR
jgi:hypothetical protein